ncbi:MAG: Xaa-Pro peptidase family protein [Nanoarchaeota archaeon]|nr:Xaa-Pro peptidase family protein [Nanoarchaeota archaeon]
MKIPELQAILRKKKLSAAVFVSLEHGDVHMDYFGCYSGGGLLCVPARKKPFIITHELEFERAKTSGLRVFLWPRKKRLFEFLSTKIRGAIGMDLPSTSTPIFIAAKKKFKVKDIHEEVLKIRSAKTKEELRKIKRACVIADEILDSCVNQFKKFKTEKDVATFLELETIGRGCSLAFPVIVASEKNASMPHYEPRNVKLNKGFCVLDFGVKFDGYCSDITRTIYLGKPSPKEIALYKLVQGAQDAAFLEISKTKSCKKIHLAACKALGKENRYFIHSLGHGFGLEVHEYPGLSSLSPHKIEEGMTFTIEPGIYLPKKLGIRIEADYVLLKGEAVRLTKQTGLISV